MPDQSQAIVKKMMDNDAFSQWLGIEVTAVSPGRALLTMTVRKEMTNGFGIAHGGITYSFADSALAFACNGHGRHAMSIETSISHMSPVRLGDVLTAEAKELNLTNGTGHYVVEVKNQENKSVAHFKGTVYRTKKEWELYPKKA